MIKLIENNLLELIIVIGYITMLIYASVYDCRYLIVQNRVHILIGILVLLSGDFTFFKLAGAIIITVPILILATYKHLIGGGDIKFIFVNALYHGFSAGYAGIVIGLCLAVIYALICKLILKHPKEKIPLIPFLSLGFISIMMIESL